MLKKKSVISRSFQYFSSRTALLGDMIFKIRIFFLKKARVAVRKSKYKIDVSMLKNKKAG